MSDTTETHAILQNTRPGMILLSKGPDQLNHNVTILKWQNTQTLTRDGVFIDNDVPSVSRSSSSSELRKKADALALELGTTVKDVRLPDVFQGGYDLGNILVLAEAMGYMKNTGSSIFEALDRPSEAGASITINGYRCTTELNIEEVHHNLESASYIKGVNLFSQLVWWAVATDGEEEYGYPFTLQSLCDATASDDGLTWFVEIEERQVEIKLLKAPE